MSAVTTETPTTPWAAYAGLTLTALFWAGNAVLARGVVGDIPPVALSFWRWVLALVVLLPFGLPSLYRQRRILRRHWRRMLLLAALSVGVFNTLLYLAALTTTAVNIALINANLPVVVALLAWLILGMPIRGAQGIGIGLALGGMLVIVTRAAPGNLVDLAFRPGDLIMLAAVLSWSLYTVLMRRDPIPLNPLGFLTAQILFGLPVILPFYLLELALAGGFTPQWHHLPAIGYVAVFAGILAFTFWNYGTRRVGPPRAAMFMYLIPVFAALLAWLLLGERLEAYHAAGGLLILAGLWLATRAPATGGH
jgi:drug/metabolite transporter (DMT)-like permease